MAGIFTPRGGPRRSSGLGLRILRRVFVLYLGVALFVTLTQILIEYHRERAAVLTQVAEAGETFSPALAAALWNFDQPQVQGVLTGLRKVAGVDGVQLIDAQDKILHQTGLQRAPDGTTMWSDAVAGSDRPKSYGVLATQVIPIDRDLPQGRVMHLAVLTLTTDRHVVIQRVANQLMLIVVNSLIKTVALWLIVVLVLRRMLIKPLHDLSREVSEMTLDDLAKPSAVAMPVGTELADLQGAFSAMRANLLTEMDLRRAAAEQTHELTIARDLAEHRSQARAAFLAVMSHEIRTPLNAIVGFTAIALEDHPAPPLREHLQRIRGAGEMLQLVVNDILDFSKIDAGRLEVESVPYDPREVTARLLALFEPSARQAGLGFAIICTDEVPSAVRGDPVRLTQVLTNLVGNAIKFTPAGTVSVTIGWSAERLVCTVADSGIGMDEATIARLFQPFTQADSSMTRRFGGTGLGLVISKSLVEAMGGGIQVLSTPGQGTTMSLSILAPRCAAVPAVESSQADLHGLTILVVDDQELNRIVAREILLRRGANVVCAGGGQEALDLLAAGQVFSAVLMDIQMPELDGFETTRRLRLLPGRASLPVFACTAHAFSEERERCLAAGMNDHISKPIDAKRLGALLGRLQHDATPSHASDGQAGSVPALDRAALVEALGDAAMVDDTIAEFLASAAQALRQMRTYAAAGELIQLARESHSVKGMALTMRAVPLAEAVKQVEMAARAGQPTDSGSFDHLDGVLAQIRAELAART